MIKKEVLVITPFFPPSGNPQSLQSVRLVEALSNAGISVDVISVNMEEIGIINSHKKNDMNFGFNNLEINNSKSSMLKKTKIGNKIYKLLRPYDSLGIYKSIFEEIRKQLIKKKYNYIISISEPLATHIATYANRKLWNDAKVIFFYSDPVPLTANKEMMHLWVRRYICKIYTIKCIESAEIIISVTDEILEPLIKLVPQKSIDSFICLPHCFTSKDWPWLENDIEELSLKTKIEVLHSGALYYLRKPDKLIEGVIKYNENVNYEERIIIYFQGPIAKEIQDTIESTKQNEVPYFFIETSNYKQSKETIKGSDILCIIDCSMKKNVHLPSKVADYVGACKPILYIGNNDSPTCRLLQDIHPAFRQANTIDEIQTSLKVLVKNHPDMKKSDYLKVYKSLLAENVYKDIVNRINNEDQEIYLTIIMATYNSEKYLEASLQSLKNNLSKLKQKDMEINIEILAIDGGSTDKTIEILRKCGICRVVKQESQGLVKAFNEAVQLAHGKYVTFLHSDDEYSNNYLYDMLTMLKKTRIFPMVVYSSIEFIDEFGNALYIRKPPKYVGLLHKYSSIIFHPNAMYPTAEMKKIPFEIIANNVCGDREQIFKLMKEVKNYRRLSNTYYRFRISLDSTTVKNAKTNYQIKLTRHERIASAIARCYIHFYETKLFRRICMKLIGKSYWGI